MSRVFMELHYRLNDFYQTLYALRKKGTPTELSVP